MSNQNHESIQVTLAERTDLDWLTETDRHLSADQLAQKIATNQILTMRVDDQPIGLLRWGLFWDELPFMNLLWVEERWRGRGFGRKLVTTWENLMQQQGHPFVLTSTQSDEQAQHFYRKLGYTDCGALLLPREPLEIILLKGLVQAA